MTEYNNNFRQPGSGEESGEYHETPVQEMVENPQTVYTAPVKESAGLSIAAFVMSLLALTLSVTVVMGILFGVLGLVFGIIGLNKGGKGFAIAAIVISIVSLVIVALFVTGMIMLFSNIIEYGPDFASEFKNFVDEIGGLEAFSNFRYGTSF